MEEMDGSRKRIADYYGNVARLEWNRLDRLASGRLEFAVNMSFIRKHLPARSRVLDIGGGPGRYAIALAGEGHRVMLADLSPDLLELARQEIARAGVVENIEAVLEMDAQAMSRLADGSFDAVLALGPFYHLLTPEGRDRAAREIQRILVSGGMLFSAWIPRPKVLKELILAPNFNADTRDILARVQEDGVALGSLGKVRGGMTDVYCADPAEIKPFFEERGFESIALIGSEGMFAEVADRIEEMRSDDPERFAQAWELLLRTAEDPSILGSVAHLLYVGRKVVN